MHSFSSQILIRLEYGEEDDNKRIQYDELIKANAVDRVYNVNVVVCVCDRCRIVNGKEKNTQKKNQLDEKEDRNKCIPWNRWW